MIYKLKSKRRRWLNRHQHEDYFISNEEYKWARFCDDNKEFCDDLCNAFTAIAETMPTAEEACDALMAVFGESGVGDGKTKYR